MMRPPPEAEPLWLWVTIGLTALGTLAYYAASLLAEYLMPRFGKLGLKVKK
jgi:hypothetical protein